MNGCGGNKKERSSSWSQATARPRREAATQRGKAEQKDQGCVITRLGEGGLEQAKPRPRERQQRSQGREEGLRATVFWEQSFREDEKILEWIMALLHNTMNLLRPTARTFQKQEVYAT